MNTVRCYLNQVHEVLKVVLLVDGEPAVVVDDVVVLHLAVAAHTQRVVTGEIGALSHQEQAGFWRVKQAHRLIPCDFPMEPSVRNEGRVTVN